MWTEVPQIHQREQDLPIGNECNLTLSTRQPQSLITPFVPCNIS